jgi:DHA1 family bicyclomycin/chloramphenicol resistance-like MFS transporter
VSRPHEAVQPSPLILLVFIAASGASILSTDLYAPTLPHLPAYFGTDAATVQLTMALNMATFAVAQLFWGPLADALGRRPVFLAGMGVFVLTAVGAAIAQSIGELLAARIAMGAAASVEAVVVLAVIGDIYRGEAQAKVYAMYGMIIALVPAVGPVIGGFVFEWFGWRANFALLAAVIVVVFVLGAMRLPETLLPEKRRSLRLGAALARYLHILGNGGFVLVAASLGLALGAIFAFITEAPFVLIDRHGLPTRYYGLSQGAIVAAFFVGSLVANRIVDRTGVERLYSLGIWAASLSGLLIILSVAVGDTPFNLTAAMGVFAFALGPMFASAPVIAFARVGEEGRGTSAAMLSTFEMGGGAIGATAVSLAPEGTAWPLAITVGVAALLIFVCGRLALRATARPA